VIFLVLMRFILTLVGAAGIAGTKPECTVVPAGGEYYAKIGIGKYLYLEVAEDSKSFRTSLGDFAETTSEEDDSEEEDDWVKSSKFLVSKVDFEMKPNCKAEIARPSWDSYGGLLRSLSNVIGICIHPGGEGNMVYNPVKDEISLGCLTLRRAVDGIVRFREKVLEPKKDTLFVARGLYLNYDDGKVYFIRVADRSRIWLKVANGEQTSRMYARYEIQDGEVCLISGKTQLPEDQELFASFWQEVALNRCMQYSSENQTLTLGARDFKFGERIPRQPLAYP
jgi:hypothetical protein